MVDNRYDGRLPEPPYECPSCAKWSVTANDQAQTIEVLRAEAEVLRQGRLSDPLLKATVGPLIEDNAALRSRNEVLEKVVEALEKIANYDWVKGGRIIFGNADLPGDAGQFYRGYNAGIMGQFEATKAIADAALDAAKEGK